MKFKFTILMQTIETQTEQIELIAKSNSIGTWMYGFLSIEVITGETVFLNPAKVIQITLEELANEA